MGQNQDLRNDECWICRRKKEELKKLGFEFIDYKIPYEKGMTDPAGVAHVTICLVCDGLVRPVMGGVET